MQHMSAMDNRQAGRINVTSCLHSPAIGSSLLHYQQSATISSKPPLDLSHDGSSMSSSELHQEHMVVGDSLTSRLAGPASPTPHAMLPSMAVKDPVLSAVTGRKEPKAEVMSMTLSQSLVAVAEGSNTTCTGEDCHKDADTPLPVGVTRSSNMLLRRTALLDMKESKKVEDSLPDSNLGVSPSVYHDLSRTADTSVPLHSIHGLCTTQSSPPISISGNHPHTSGTGSHPHTAASSHPHTSSTGSHPHTSATGSHPHTSSTGSHPHTSTIGGYHAIASTIQTHIVTGDHDAAGNPSIIPTQVTPNTHPRTGNTNGSPPSPDGSGHIAVASNLSCTSSSNGSHRPELTADGKSVETKLCMLEKHGQIVAGTQERPSASGPVAEGVSLEQNEKDDSFWESRSESLSKDGQTTSEDPAGNKALLIDQARDDEIEHGTILAKNQTGRSSPTGNGVLTTDYSKAIPGLLAVLNQQLRVDRELAGRIYSSPSLTDDMSQLINHSEVVASIVTKSVWTVFLWATMVVIFNSIAEPQVEMI